MKRILLPVFVFHISCFTSAIAQANLVPNWSFEDTSNCPNDVGQIYSTLSWFSATSGTPDYYNECASFTSQASVPQNGFGFQYPKTGVAYAGILTYQYQTGSGGREYIEIELLDSLTKGKKYCISFNVSLIESAAPIDALQALLTKDSVISIATLTLPYQPSITNESGHLINDTLNWVLISGEYVAGGGGNFFNYR